MRYPDVDPELLALLPPILKAVVRALGYPRAREWLMLYGGVTVQVPKRKEQAIGLGPEELDRLRAVLSPHLDANHRVTLPKADKLLQLSRNAVIRSEKWMCSITAQARMYGLSSRQIVNIRGEDTDTPQLGLF